MVALAWVNSVMSLWYQNKKMKTFSDAQLTGLFASNAKSKALAPT